MQKEKLAIGKKILAFFSLLVFFPVSLFAQVEDKKPADTTVEETAATTTGDSQDAENLAIEEKLSPEEDKEADWKDEIYAKFIHDRLEIGTRSSLRYLTDSDSGHKGGTYGTGTFLGTIYALDEIQDVTPNKFYLTYYLTRYFGFELAYDSIEAETVAWDTTYDKQKTDGDVSLSGPTLALVARYPNKSKFTPYLGVGLGFFSGSFDRDPAWAYTDWGSADRNRYMVVDDTTAIFANAGVTWKVYKNWFVDTSVQYLSADADATFYGYTDDVCDTVQTGHYPLDNVSFRLGIGFSF